MKMKTVSKILVALMIVFVVATALQPIAFAADDAASIAGSIKPNTDGVDSTNVQNMASRVLGIIQIATAIAAVILVAVFGFKFVLGSAQEKADYQKSFIPLIVGVVVVFAATSIAKMIMGVASGANG